MCLLAPVETIHDNPPLWKSGVISFRGDVKLWGSRTFLSEFGRIQHQTCPKKHFGVFRCHFEMTMGNGSIAIIETNQTIGTDRTGLDTRVASEEKLRNHILTVSLGGLIFPFREPILGILRLFNCCSVDDNGLALRIWSTLFSENWNNIRIGKYPHAS